MRRFQYKRLFRKHGILYYKAQSKENLKRIWNKYKLIMGIK